MQNLAGGVAVGGISLSLSRLERRRWDIQPCQSPIQGPRGEIMEPMFKDIRIT